MTVASANDKPTAGAAGWRETHFGLDWLQTTPQWLSPARATRLLWALILLGLAARLVRYLLRFPLWPDEAYLATNFLDREYLGLLQGLDNHQVAPLLFLWTQLTVVKLLGFSEYTLRLFPLLCGVGSLLLFADLARRLVKGLPLLLAVGCFASTYALIRYSCEAKPYSSDVLVAVGLLWLTIRFLTETPHTNRRWLWLLAVVVPIAVGLSYPAVFVAGGIAIAVVLRSLPEGDRRDWAACTVYCVALVGSFGLFYVLSTANQVAAELESMRQYWRHIFPPLEQPLRLLGWMVVTHTSELLAYPLGGARGASILTALCCLAAVIALFRRRQHLLLVLCLAPAALNFVAACLQRYPYAGEIRFSLYLAPIICLLFAAGAAILLSVDERGRNRGPVPAMVVIVLLAIIPVASLARDFVRPYKTLDALRERDFARWFWFTKAYDADLICLETDVGRDFFAARSRSPGMALYLCNMRIYSPRRAAGDPPLWDGTSSDRPLRCVRFRSSPLPYPEDAFQQWLEEMQTRYQLAAYELHAFPMHHKDRELLGYQWLELYEFRAGKAQTHLSARSIGDDNHGGQHR